jgi:3-oxoacyl-(acyl-carrier-protein) synthase
MYAPVYVVGYGMIDTLGNNPADCFSNMLNDKDYVIPLDFMGDYKIKHAVKVNDNSLKIPDTISSKQLSHMTRAQKFALHATDQALKMSGLPQSSNVAVIVSSVSNDVEMLDAGYIPIKSGKRVNPFKVVNRIPDMIPAHICTNYGFMGASYSLYASCATGLFTIDAGMRLCDEYDYVVVGGSDAASFEMAIKYFGAIGALGNYNAPFDDRREGFIMGEGSGVLILQSEQKVEEYNSTVYAKLYPVGSASDAFDLTSPASDGRGAKLAMEKALFNIDSIDAVNAHATSTFIGDPIEYTIVTNRFPNVPMYAPKSKLGHTLSAAGVLETIYAIESMKNKIIPHCQNLVKCSYDTHNVLVKSPMQMENKTLRTLNNSFGFGGKCCSQVIEV